MNQAFVEAVNSSGLTQYQLSKRSGVRFATINGLMNNRQDVNNCSVATMLRLAEVMGVDVYKLLNKNCYLDGVEGIHHNIKYKWIMEDDQLTLSFKDGRESVNVETGLKLNDQDSQRYAEVFAGWFIDEYYEDKQFSVFVESMNKRGVADE